MNVMVVAIAPLFTDHADTVHSLKWAEKLSKAADHHLTSWTPAPTVNIDDDSGWLGGA